MLTATMRSLLCLVTLVVNHAAGLACELLEPTAVGDMACPLQSFGVRDPTAIVAALSQAALHSAADVSMLNVAEAAELFEDLRAGAIPLGNRTKLRKATAAWGENDQSLWAEHPSAFEQGTKGRTPSHWKRACTTGCKAQPRQPNAVCFRSR